MKKIINLALLIIATLVISGCGAAKTTLPVVSSDSVATTTANIVNVDIRDFTFIPDFITVKPGATVTWTNNDATLHRIKSETFNSEKLSPGQSFSFTFNDPGIFPYFCFYNTFMGGQIIVQ